MKRLLLICAVALIAFAQQSCVAALHASHRYPGHGPHVVVRVEPPRKYPKKHYKKYRKPGRHGAYGRPDYGMRHHRPEPPRKPEPPRRHR